MSPAVNLALEEVPFAILEAVKARIMANRRRLGVGRDGERPPPSLKPRPQLRKFGASSKSYRRPEPAATGGPSGYHALWIAVNDTSIFDGNYVIPGGSSPVFPGVGSSKRFWIFSLNGQFKLEAVFPYPSAISYDVAVAKYILPIDKYNLILVLCMLSRPSAIDKPVDIQCFRVSKSTVRKIDTPNTAQVNTFADYLSVSGLPPNLIGTNRTISMGFSSMGYIFPERTVTFFSRAKFGDIYSASYSYQQLYMPFNEFSDTTYSELSHYSPGIYTFMLSNAEAYNVIDLFNSEYENFQQAYNLIESSHIGPEILPEKNYNISILGANFSQLLVFTKNDQPVISNDYGDGKYAPVQGKENSFWSNFKQKKSKSTKPDNPYKDPRSLVFPSFFWNWDKPDYCKEKLLLCGFTESDLTP